MSQSEILVVLVVFKNVYIVLIVEIQTDFTNALVRLELWDITTGITEIIFT